MAKLFTAHVAAGLWPRYSVSVCGVAALHVFEVAPLGHLVEGEVVASRVARAGALAVVGRSGRERADRRVAAGVGEIVET